MTKLQLLWTLLFPKSTTATKDCFSQAIKSDSPKRQEMISGLAMAFTALAGSTPCTYVAISLHSSVLEVFLPTGLNLYQQPDPHSLSKERLYLYTLRIYYKRTRHNSRSFSAKYSISQLKCLNL